MIKAALFGLGIGFILSVVHFIWRRHEEGKTAERRRLDRIMRLHNTGGPK